MTLAIRHCVAAPYPLGGLTEMATCRFAKRERSTARPLTKMPTTCQIFFKCVLSGSSVRALFVLIIRCLGN